MRFIANGPDIPETLLHAHEDGRVVLFCGSGISHQVGLKGFKWLVEEIYRRCGADMAPAESLAFEKGLYDTTLNVLEQRLPGQRRKMREALARTLKIQARLGLRTDTHRALLDLGRTKKGELRLVTTNYDRAFELVAHREKVKFERFLAPLLPVAKASQLDGLVYLHGLLPADNAKESALDKLVVTSGDFGLAYLTERWAAQFVGELFRNFIVCFVGYSVSDPVLRYMVDALAADRLRGEDSIKAYALVDLVEGDEEKSIDAWKSKGIHPIPYDASNGDHSSLHETLKIWSEQHRDGVRGKEGVVLELAASDPTASTRQEDLVGRMLWALSDSTGRPAQLFAEFDPVPSVAWLKIFSEPVFCAQDLDRFGVVPNFSAREDPPFSLLCRPGPYSLAARMALASHGLETGRLDDVMWQMARWMVRHLGDPELLIWLVEQGGCLHQQFARLVERKLAELANLEAEGNDEELRRIRDGAKRAVPGPLTRVLWNLLLAGRMKCGLPEPDPYDWVRWFNREGMRPIVKLQLRNMLAARIKVRKRLSWYAVDEPSDEEARIDQLVDWELVLAARDVRSALTGLDDTAWRACLPTLFNEFQQLLLDAFDLLLELGQASEREDLSFWHLPSISAHAQNSEFRDWTILIELLREAWFEVLKRDPSRASSIAREWFQMPYPTFKRLALFASAQGECIPPDEWVEWLVQDRAWWLWSLQTKRETMRLLVARGKVLSGAVRERLEATILEGPPREMYSEDVDAEEWEEHVKQSVWLLLAKLTHEEEALGRSARERLRQVPKGWPEWRKVRDGERNEFSHWTGGPEDPEFEGLRQVVKSPRRRKELAEWLKQPVPSAHPLYEDDWREVCRQRLFVCLAALCDLAREDIWPQARWAEALQAWGDEGLARRSWRYGRRLVFSMPDAVLSENLQSVSRWLERVAKGADHSDSDFLDFCGRLLDHPCEGVADNLGPVTQAINHPVGMVAQSVFDAWFESRPGDDDGMPEAVAALLTRLCDVGEDRFRLGRLILASRAIALFRIDRNWFEEYLLPLFDWSRNRVEALAVWEGFLTSSRLHPPLLRQLKDQFLLTVDHYSEFVDNRREVPWLLTNAALERIEGFQPQDFRNALEKLPSEGLLRAAGVLAHRQEGSGERRGRFWKNRVKPFLQQVWPQHQESRSKGISEYFALLAIAADDEFPDALNCVRDWLIPIEQIFGVVGRVGEAELCRRFPAETLELLNAIVGDISYGPEEVASCLGEIAKSSPDLQTDYRFRKLQELSGHR